MSTSLAKWRQQHFVKHQFCYWCGCQLQLTNSDSKQADNEATIDHLRSRFDPTRTEPAKPNEPRRVLSCYKCNQNRGRRECEENIDLQRTKSGNSIELSQRPYLERKRFLAILEARAESSLAGLISVTGGHTNGLASRCSLRKSWLTSADALINLRPTQVVYQCPYCSLWHRTSKTSLTRKSARCLATS